MRKERIPTMFKETKLTRRSKIFLHHQRLLTTSIIKEKMNKHSNFSIDAP